MISRTEGARLRAAQKTQPNSEEKFATLLRRFLRESPGIRELERAALASDYPMRNPEGIEQS